MPCILQLHHAVLSPGYLSRLVEPNDSKLELGFWRVQIHGTLENAESHFLRTTAVSPVPSWHLCLIVPLLWSVCLKHFYPPLFFYLKKDCNTLRNYVMVFPIRLKILVIAKHLVFLLVCSAKSGMGNQILFDNQLPSLLTIGNVGLGRWKLEFSEISEISTGSPSCAEQKPFQTNSDMQHSLLIGDISPQYHFSMNMADHKSRVKGWGWGEL